MVYIRYDSITDEILEVAHMISNAQKTDVTIITPTTIMEVRYEKEKADGEEGHQT